MGLAERWHGREVEAFERLAHGQACLPEMALDAAAITLGQLQLGQSARNRAAGHPSRSALSANAGHRFAKVGRRSAVSISGQLGGIGGNLGRGTHAASSRAAKSAS